MSGDFTLTTTEMLILKCAPQIWKARWFDMVTIFVMFMVVGFALRRS